MPFVSLAQQRLMWAKHPEMAKEWQAHTAKGVQLPRKKEQKNVQRKLSVRKATEH